MSVFLSRISFLTLRCTSKRCFAINSPSEAVSARQRVFAKINYNLSNFRQWGLRNITSNVPVPVEPLENSTIPLKKKASYKKAVLEELKEKDGHYLTIAYATSTSYDLKGLKQALVEQKLYAPETLKANEVGDIVVASAVYSVGSEPREIIFFKEGAVVFWNCTELEASNVLDLVKRFEIESYPREVVQKEREVMTYIYQSNAKKCHLQQSCFVLVGDKDNSLERYTFSHAMAQSARLGALEARLESLAADVRIHSAAMEREGATKVDKKEVVRKLGQLFSLRHRLNVESDLLDTPDLYWEDERLEKLYSSTVSYFTIPNRTSVLNARLAHCVELLELLSQWAADRHHVRLEWMIIVLISAELVCELLHYIDRWA